MMKEFIKRSGKIFFVWNEWWCKYEFWRPKELPRPKITESKKKPYFFYSGFCKNRGRHFDRRSKKWSRKLQRMR